ncbi:major tail protein [Coprococcus sp. AM97-06]|uniref:major tail protein n=1 Tax=Coprococcus sp. AM97-06 TaxID=2997993 RepID=UPI0022E231E6|nr:major tail protein [Coprococcus sp. AM97-06]
MMAYIGVARPVIAKYEESNGNITYSEGFRFGKAIKVVISPNYEDVSEYGGINDTEEDQEFSDADIVMNTSETPEVAERLMFGHITNGDEVMSGVEDRANYVGMGIRVAEVASGKKVYVAIWIHKVKFSDGEQEHETKGDSIKYGTPEIKGKAVPDCNGKWRTKKRFWTKKEADEWLQRKAGI